MLKSKKAIKSSKYYSTNQMAISNIQHNTLANKSKIEEIVQSLSGRNLLI